MSWKWLQKKCYPDHPKSATAEEWVEWHKVEKKKPICDWLVNTMPRWFRVKAMRLRDIKFWFKYRLINDHKYHLIDTGLTPNYHEIETRMLHGMFNMLKEFVEEESAWSSHTWGEAGKELDAEEAGEKYKRKKFVPGREAGLAALKWQKELVWQEDEIWDEDKKYLIGQPTDQALTAKEIEELYLWWVDVYPNRPEPYDVYPDPDETHYDDPMEILARPMTDERKARHENVRALEEQYENEDTEMLMRLIKIRGALWT